MSHYIDCHYARSRVDQTKRPYLDGTIATGTVVVGGGLAGLTIALELARGGHFGRAAGRPAHRLGRLGTQWRILAPGYAVGYDRIAQMAGQESARELLGLSQDGVDYIASNLAAFGMKVDPRRRGHLSARRVPPRGELERYRDKMAALGLDLRVQGIEETRAQLKSPLYFESSSS